MDETPVDGEVGAVQSWEPVAPNSLVDQIREELKELSEVQEVYIPVVGYERVGLQVKYRMPESGRELQQIGQRAARETKDRFSQSLNTAMDTMIHLCEGLYVQPEGVDALVELDPEEIGVPVIFDERLAHIVGMNGGTGSPRAVIKKLFGNNDLAILSHSEKLSRWLANSKADLDRELWEMGE